MYPELIAVLGEVFISRSYWLYRTALTTDGEPQRDVFFFSQPQRFELRIHLFQSSQPLTATYPHHCGVKTAAIIRTSRNLAHFLRYLALRAPILAPLAQNIWMSQLALVSTVIFVYLACIQ